MCVFVGPAIGVRFGPERGAKYTGHTARVEGRMPLIRVCQRQGKGSRPLLYIQRDQKLFASNPKAPDAVFGHTKLPKPKIH